uniref:Uncharacterized protein n=1 Tax=Tetranychus urticae TaxID=32264 RepID=T1K8F5_TETUR
MYGPGPRTADNVYCLTEWSPTWVKMSDLHLGDGKILETQITAIQSCDLEEIRNCRWCGIGTDDKSNINKHEKRCNVVGAPGHIHGKFCGPNCPAPAKYTPREDGRKQNKGRPKSKD